MNPSFNKDIGRENQNDLNRKNSKSKYNVLYILFRVIQYSINKTNPIILFTNDKDILTKFSIFYCCINILEYVLRSHFQHHISVSSPDHGEYLPRVILQAGQLCWVSFKLSTQKGMRQQPKSQPIKQRPKQSNQAVPLLLVSIL